MNKQNTIDNYKQNIERLQKECAEKTDFNIKLMKRVQELEEKYNAQFAEMEEKLTAEENKNFELKEENKKLEDRFIIANAEQVDYAIKTNEKLKNVREKLKIAEEFIEFLAGGKCFSDVCKLQSRGYKNCLACFENKAQQALQKIKEANQ